MHGVWQSSVDTCICHTQCVNSNCCSVIHIYHVGASIPYWCRLWSFPDFTKNHLQIEITKQYNTSVFLKGREPFWQACITFEWISLTWILRLHKKKGSPINRDNGNLIWRRTLSLTHTLYDPGHGSLRSHDVSISNLSSATYTSVNPAFVHSLMLSFQDCLCPPLLHPDSCSSSSHSFMCSLEDYLWEVVIAGYKSKLGKLSSFHIWHKWFLMAYIILYLISDIHVCFEFPISSVYMELSSNISPQSRSRERDL